MRRIIFRCGRCGESLRGAGRADWMIYGSGQDIISRQGRILVLRASVDRYMRVVLEVLSGPLKGYRTLLREFQTLSVGRSDWVDLCCNGDHGMSRVHFVVKVGETDCVISDRTSRNGTFVNGERVTDCTLKSGDRIIASRTEIAVQMELELPQKVIQLSASPIPLASDPGWPKSTRTSGKFRYMLQPCASGLTLYRGNLHKMPVALIAQILSRARPVHLVVHPQQSFAALLEGLGDAQTLADWIEPAQQAITTPVLVEPQESDAWESIVELGWAEDSVVCLFSSTSPAAILSRLRYLARAQSYAAEDNALVDCFRPSNLYSTLAQKKGGFVSELMSVVDAVLLESSSDPNAWHIFGTAALNDILKGCGLKPQRMKPDGTDASRLP